MKYLIQFGNPTNKLFLKKNKKFNKKKSINTISIEDHKSGGAIGGGGTSSILLPPGEPVSDIKFL